MPLSDFPIDMRQTIYIVNAYTLVRHETNSTPKSAGKREKERKKEKRKEKKKMF